jgi:hypothetical protein
MVDIKELKKLTEFCRKNGIISLKKGDFEINLSPASLFPHKPRQEDNTDPITENPYTDEQMMMWSSAGIAPESEN